VSNDEPVIVIGSGPPGAAAALFLARAGIPVLVLEAGSKSSSLGLTVRLRGLTVFKYCRALRQRRSFSATSDPAATLFEELAPGGLSNHWSCAVPRFSREDFADAERAGEAFRWPIGYSDIAPWYDKIEPLLHVAGGSGEHVQLPAGEMRHLRKLSSSWSSIAAEADLRGRAVAPMPYAYGEETTATLSGTVFNSFVRLIGPELRSGRLEVRFDAKVEYLEWSSETRRVEAVVFRDMRTGAECRLGCSGVILAAGAVRTIEILLASSSTEFPEGLGNTHGVLGRYMHDHPLGKLVVDLDSPIAVYPPAYVTRRALDRADPPLYAAACMQWAATSMLLSSLRKGTPGRLSWLGFSVFGTMIPTADNWVALGPGEPRLKLNIRHPPESRIVLEKTRDELLDILTRAGRKPRIRTWLVEPVGDSKHYGGTCRMHASERFGMLNGLGRLHAVRNVAVADSSAFTTGPEKNPVLTAMALAARAAHHLAEDLRAGSL
jgi:choline dehydrogenase-like flavoprotein